MRSASSRISSRSSETSSTAAPRLRASMSCERISATAVKSRPKQGLAAIKHFDPFAQLAGQHGPLDVAARQVADLGRGRRAAGCDNGRSDRRPDAAWPAA